ncbi:MAG: hypothetical protein CMI53_00185 [Parcubacteria group bacterium]|nr:hypothetical protein [Parcubacteria group bacterium]
MIVQCCVCKKIRRGPEGSATWSLAAKEDLGPGVSHGYCPKCADKALAQIRNAQGKSVRIPK